MVAKKGAYSCVAISDFNIATLNRLLANDTGSPGVEPIETPYGQVFQLLSDPAAAPWRRNPDFALVWTRPEVQAPSFARLLRGERFTLSDVLAEVDEFVDRLAPLPERVRFAFVPTWVAEPARAFSMLGLRHETGAHAVLLQMNLRLIERLAAVRGLYPLNADPWINAAGRAAFNPKLWYMSKNPFAPDVLRSAVTAIKAALRTVAGRSKKLVVVDLDNTLWGGIVGEVGWQKLRLGGHDPLGEAYRDFQSALKALTQQGIVLGIVSRNDEAIALEAIREHPEMILRADDFAGWRIDWNDKARNVADLAASLNLGLDSVVFIDDEPVQRARVRDALPEVLVPEWPADATQYRAALLDLDCLDSVGLSAEDQQRTQMYVAERQRAGGRSQFSSVDDWLRTLGVVARCEPLNEANLGRATQLLNKTNQMNLSTRRLSETELLSWSRGEGRRVWTFRTSDKYGDLGLTGLISLDIAAGIGRIVDFLLSCRAMGRKIEETMLATAVAHARSLGINEITAQLIPTPRNGPCREFWQGSGWRRRDEQLYEWNTTIDCTIPPHVRLEMSDLLAAEAHLGAMIRL